MSAPPLPGTTQHSSASLFGLGFLEDLRRSSSRSKRKKRKREGEGGEGGEGGVVAVVVGGGGGRVVVHVPVLEANHGAIFDKGNNVLLITRFLYSLSWSPKARASVSPKSPALSYMQNNGFQELP